MGLFTVVCLRLLVVVAQRVVVETEVDLDGGLCGFKVEGVHAQHVLQLEQSHVRAQGHLPHAVRVEVKLVVCYLDKVLRTEGGEEMSLISTPCNICDWVFRNAASTHSFDLVALLERFSVFVHGLVRQSTFSLKPHTLHLVQVLHRRRAFLKRARTHISNHRMLKKIIRVHAQATPPSFLLAT